MNNKLYRNTDITWLHIFLKNGVLYGKNNYEYISLSSDSDSGSISDFGYINIEFNRDEVMKQGGIDIEYNVDFFKGKDELCFSITGYLNEKDFNSKNKKRSEYKSFQDLLDNLSIEQEVSIKSLKLTKNLISEIVINFDDLGYFEEPDSYNVETILPKVVDILRYSDIKSNVDEFIKEGLDIDIVDKKLNMFFDRVQDHIQSILKKEYGTDAEKMNDEIISKRDNERSVRDVVDVYYNKGNNRENIVDCAEAIIKKFYSKTVNNEKNKFLNFHRFENYQPKNFMSLDDFRKNK